MKQDWWMTGNGMKPTKKWVKQQQKREMYMQDKQDIISDITPIIYDFIVEHNGDENLCYDYALELFMKHPITELLNKDEYEETKESLLMEIDYYFSGEM